MKTFTEPRALVENPNYRKQREKGLRDLSAAVIDPPIVDLIHKINARSHCFTLQSCHGHFIDSRGHTVGRREPMVCAENQPRFTYRIAYVALCVENSVQGKQMLRSLKTLEAIDPENIQFGSADWFWERQANAFVLQVEPKRFRFEDQALLDYKEAVKIEKVRDQFFRQMHLLLSDQMRMKHGAAAARGNDSAK